MARFEYTTPPPLTEVVCAEGTDHEEVFKVPTPVGKKWSDLATQFLELVNTFEKLLSSSDDRGQATVDAFRMLTNTSGFYKTLLPSALGVKGTKDEKAASQYLEGALTNMEIVNVFMEAASAIVMYSFKGEEVEEALGKSEADGEEEEEEEEEENLPAS